jgi:D-glycero-D-manno-heptose 1,7-bisphosphate phosphatase
MSDKSMQSKKLVILDRDGVINIDSKAYIKSVAEWQPIPGSIAAIAALKQKGYLVAVATNQSGLARGYFDLATLNAIHTALLQAVASAGGEIAMIRYCPHLPDAGCSCRKPAPGLLLEILTALECDPSRDVVYMVGDAERDLQAALHANCRPIAINLPSHQPSYADLWSFVQTLP